MKNEDIDGGVFPAKILDRDSQLLSTGEVRLYTKLCSGMFWPQDVEDFRKTQGSAAILQMEYGGQYKLVNFRACSSHHSDVVNHWEFDYEHLIINDLGSSAVKVQ